MSYRDPLDAARARIAALEELLDTQDFVGPIRDGDERAALRQSRADLAEERAEHEARMGALQAELHALRERLEESTQQLTDERARRQAEVSLLRTKLEEAERALQNNASLFEAEQTIQRAESEVDAARLRQQLVQKGAQVRELREEIRVHLDGDADAIRAYYSARVRAVGTELAEHGSLARLLESRLSDACGALEMLPPTDVRDREGVVERELAKRKIAVGEAELKRVQERIVRLEAELERITAAEAKLAERSG